MDTINNLFSTNFLYQTIVGGVVLTYGIVSLGSAGNIYSGDSTNYSIDEIT